MRLKDEQKIDLFLTSTLTLVGQIGLVGLTMPLIAKQSGVATGTLYIYFKNKDDLIFALYKEIKKRFGATIFIGFTPQLPVDEGFRVIWENSVRYAVSNFPDEIPATIYCLSLQTRGAGHAVIAAFVMAKISLLLQRGGKREYRS